jgi:hypothetical protein
MAINAFFDGLDNATTAGKFFVALTGRLGEGTVIGGEDATHLAKAFGIAIPASLEGASIDTMAEATEHGKAPDSEATEHERESSRLDTVPLTIVISYPPTVTDPPPKELKFKKCFKVCQTVAGAKVCAQVCVDINVGLKGVSGKISETVSVTF